jgi:hypothetical protein
MISMISKILIVANATSQGSVSILDAFQLIQKDQPSVKVIFASYLSDLFKKRLGPNTLSHWMKEEKDCLERVKSYFTRMDIPYDFKVITVPPWEMVFHEMKDEVHDLIMLQSEFLKMWRKEGVNCALCSDAISKSKSHILLINSNEEAFYSHLGL